MRFIAAAIVLSFPVLDLIATARVARWSGVPIWVWLLGGAAAGVAVLRNERVAFRSRTVAAMHGEVSVMRGLLDSGRKVLAGFLLIVPGIVSDLAALALLAPPINQGGNLLAVGDFARTRALGGDWRRVD